jgi:hypothetical protein
MGPCSRNVTKTALKIPSCEGRLKAATQVSIERLLKKGSLLLNFHFFCVPYDMFLEARVLEDRLSSSLV